ncbi:MAG: EF-Tu/IF-2/RF-3 family GTPase, partial [Nitrospinota bacterium]
QVDVLTGDFLTWPEEGGGAVLHRRPAEGPLAEKGAALREELIEALADHDEAVMEAFLEAAPVGDAAAKAALRKAVLAGALVPVFCGAALHNRGVQPLLDAVVDYLPSPEDLPPAVGHRPGEDGAGRPEERAPTEDAPFSALVFKVQMDGGRRLTYLRVYSGKARVGEEVWNARAGAGERLSRLFRMYSHKRERLAEVGPGDIVAAAGLKRAATGDTLCAKGKPIRFESIAAPHPVISVAVEPRDAAGAKKLDETLRKLEAEDPTFRVSRDEGTGQILMSGMGELHLDVLTRRITEEFGVAVRVGRPRVVYRETLRGEAEAEAVFDRELGGKPQFARLAVRVRPAPGGGVRYRSCVAAAEAGGEVPAALLRAAEDSIRASAGSGYLAGYEMTDLSVELLSAEYDPERASEAAFGVAAGQAFGEACRAAGGQLLEPVMAVEVTAPEEFIGGVIGDLNARDGQIEGVEKRGGTVPYQIVRAQVGLARMFGYATSLRSITQGRAAYTMHFSHYAPAELQTA